jgi:hypothetical protein
MPKGPQKETWFFKVQPLHLLSMAILFVLAVQNIIIHLASPDPFAGDYVMLLGSGMGLALFAWNFHAEGS